MKYTNEQLKKNNWTIIKANTVAAAGHYVGKDVSRYVTLNVHVYVDKTGTYAEATDSYRVGRFRTADNYGAPSVGKVNEPGTSFLLKWDELTKAKLFASTPKKNLWLALRREGDAVHVMALELVPVNSFEVTGEHTMAESFGNFPNLEVLDNRDEYLKNPAKFAGGGNEAMTPGLNTNYVIDVFQSIKKGVSYDGATVTQWIHRGLLEPVHFIAKNKFGEEAWAMVMPVRL